MLGNVLARVLLTLLLNYAKIRPCFESISLGDSLKVIEI